MSIRLKLTLYWASVLAIIVVIAAVSVYVIFERQQWAALDAALLEEADTSAATIARLQEPAAVSFTHGLSEERDIGPAKRVRLSAGDKIIADFGSPDADLPTPNNKQRGIFNGDRHVYRYAIMPLVMDRQDAILEDGVDPGPVRSSIARLRAILLIITPLLLLASVAAGYWLAGRSLLPINALAQELARIEPKDLHRRLPIGAARDEVARLAGTINALLTRLENASMAERRFISDAAHELRTPLTVLRTGLEITLNRERNSKEFRQALESALREVVALCRMEDELLTLARLSEEAFVQRVPVDLGELVREAVETMEPLTHSKNLTLLVSGDNDLVVQGNPGHLRRLVVNLLDNAVKFTPESGQIKVHLERRDGSAVIRIADSGPGIAPADLPFIFERFFRGGGPKANGSGLGLSLCRELVRLHQGNITAHNNPEQGCEFVVTLPLQDAA